MKPFNYDKLEKNGFVPENNYVENNDIIIGKCMQLNQMIYLHLKIIVLVLNRMNLVL